MVADMPVADQRAGLGDDDVASERDLQAAGDGMAMQHRNDRQRAGLEPTGKRRHRAQKRHWSIAGLVQRKQMAQVGARAEAGSGAGDQYCMGRCILFRVGQRRGKRIDQLGVERISLSRAVER